MYMAYISQRFYIKSHDLDISGTAIRHCPNTYPAWYTDRFTCCSSESDVGGMFRCDGWQKQTFFFAHH